MINIHATQRVGATLPSPEARLQDAVTQLEGVFVEQLFKSMRETVPEDGLTNGGAGEEMFTSLMDQHLAAGVPAHWDHGLTQALTRQLQGTRHPADTTTGPTVAEGALAGAAGRVISTNHASTAPAVAPTDVTSAGRHSR